METSNFYRLQQQRRSVSSLAAQSIPGVAAIHEGNPSLHPNIDDYSRYMNVTLPNPTESLPTTNANFPDMGYHDYESCTNPSTSIQNAVDLNQNLCLTWACPTAAALTNNCVFNDIMTTINASSNWSLLSSTSSIDSTHMAMKFLNNNGCDRIHHQDSTYTQSTNSNKISEGRNKAISSTKRSISTSSGRRQSQDEAVKKQKAVTQASCSLPKVGKEKIGDRIAGLHRLVAPFGKTDAASVLTEAIGYIQFLQHQIQTLSMPCIKPSQRDRRPFEWVSSKQDLRSRGLCLVPSSIASYISSSCTGLDAV